MKKFLFIYNAGDDGDGAEEAWMGWFTSIGKSLVDLGNPFNGGMHVKENSANEITESADFIGGYSLVNAEDMAAAVILAKSCPNKAGLRIFEALPM